MLGSDGGRLFFSEGVWIFDGSISASNPNIHFLSTSPGKTVFKRPSTSTTTTSLLTFTGDGVTIEGIRFIDEVKNALAVLRFEGDAATVKGCVFEDVKAGVYVTDANDSLIKCNRFQTVKDRAVEIDSSANVDGHLVNDNIFTPSTDGDNDVYFGDDVSESGIFSNNFAPNGKISYKAGQDIVGDETTNVIQAADITVRP